MAKCAEDAKRNRGERPGSFAGADCVVRPGKASALRQRRHIPSAAWCRVLARYLVHSELGQSIGMRRSRILHFGGDRPASTAKQVHRAPRIGPPWQSTYNVGMPIPQSACCWFCDCIQGHERRSCVVCRQRARAYGCALAHRTINAQRGRRNQALQGPTEFSRGASGVARSFGEIKTLV